MNYIKIKRIRNQFNFIDKNIYFIIIFAAII
jgi:hypothetical protein